MLVFIKNNIEKSRNLISLFYGPRYKRKDILNRFHNWRKSEVRSDSEKNSIIIEGTRSQYTEQFKNWKWIIIQTVLWLAISIKYDFQGPNYSVASACATASHAIGDAFRLIQYGDADAIVCGGSDATITPMGVSGFAK